MRIRFVLLVLVVAFAGIPATASASSQKRPLRHSSPLVLRVWFHRVGSADPLLSGGQYVFLASAFPGLLSPPSGGTLIDDRTGRRTAITRAGCSPVVLGGPWLLFGCETGPPLDPQSTYHMELYSISSGSWRYVSLNPQLYCEVAKLPCESPLAVGAHWIEFAGGGCASDPSHCVPTHIFQNIQTGNTAPDPTESRTLADLDSPSLSRPVCAPLRLPRNNLFSGEVRTPATVFGSLTFYGSFAISNGTNGFGPGPYLERCGTRLHESVSRDPTYLDGNNLCDAPNCAPVANSNVVVWKTEANHFGGLILPSLRRFTFAVPATVGAAPGIALSYRDLYAVSNGQVWSARVPQKP